MARVRPFPLASISFVSILAASTAHAERTETPQQLYKTGDSVSLPAIGATIVLPPAPAGWAVNMGMESSSNYDILRRQDPTNPALQIDLNRPKSASCAAIATGFDKLIAAGLKLKKYDPTPFAPASFERWGYELSFYQDKSVLKLCTNTPNGPVLAELNFQGPLASLDPTWSMALLDEVARAVNGSRSTGAAAAEPSPSSSGQTVMLPITGLPAVVPPGFNHRVYGSPGKQEDLIEREGSVYLSIMVNKKPGSCSLNANAEGAHFVYDPPYLPPGFESKVVEISLASGNSIAVMCLQKSGYYVLASVGHAGSLTHPDVMVTRTILAPMAAGGSSSSSGNSGGKLGSDFSDKSGDDKKPDDNKAQATVTFELGYLYTRSDVEQGFDKSEGVSIGLDAFSHSKEGPFGGAAEIAGSVGIGKEGFLPWDVRIGVGPALIANPLVIAPLVGVGADGIGGSTNDAPLEGGEFRYHLRMDSGAYYYYGGRASVWFGGSFGISGYFTLHRRSPDDLDREQRFGLALLISKYALGVRSTTYSHSDVDVKAGITNFYFGFRF